MEHGQGSIRRNAKLGAFVASLMLAVMLPTMAFAAVASFSSKVPAAGSTITAMRPTISTVVYDRYGVLYGKYSITLDGVKRPTRLTRISGLTKFKLSYAVPSNLSIGTHTVTVAVRDRRGYLSKTTWSFRVADGTPPVTTSDAGLNYTGLAVINLSATDNVGIEETHYVLDGGAELTYSGPINVESASALQTMHSLEFWSEDTSDNEEAHQTVFFNVSVPWGTSHAMPTAEAVSLCVTTACHGTDFDTDMPANLASIHKEFTCAPCHANGQTPISNCNACHADAHEGTHPVIPSVSTDPAPCTASTCHGTNAISIHADCFQCHTSESQIVIDAIEAGMGEDPTLATCESCHPAGFPTIHADGNAPHVVASGDVSTCGTGNGASCHDGNAVAIHEDGPGCTACHEPGEATPPTVSCTQSGFGCHTAGLNVHPVLPEAHITANTCATGNSAACHSSNVATIHTSGATPPGCIACHGTGITPSADCDASGCHDGTEMPVNPHVAVAAHTVPASGCFNSNCHSTDVSLIHGGAVVTPRPGCADCHNSEVTASTDCDEVCHTNLNGPEDPHNSVFGATPTAHHIDPPACTTCHVQATGLPSCIVCHEGDGFDVGNISGHSTPNGGAMGMYEKYDGTENPDVVLRDSNGDVVTAEWAIPNDRVFWDKSEIDLGGFKPENAFLGEDGMGLSADSVITCKDCHTGLEVMDAGDPQGANLANAMIDPDYPVPFTMAQLSGHSSGNYDAYTTRSGISYRTAVTGPNDPIRDGTRAVICAKCHDLYQEMEIDSNEASATATGDTRLTNAAVENGYGQLAHYDHARSQATGGTTGRGDCVNCHIAVPHGWSRPRLLVQSIDATIVLTNEDGVTTRTVAITPDPYPYNQVRGFWSAASSSWESTPGPLAATGFITTTTQKTGFGVLPARDASGNQVAHDMESEEITLTVDGVATGGFTFEYPEWASSQCSAGCGSSRHPLPVSGRSPRSIIE